jgi:hypothetical protein
VSRTKGQWLECGEARIESGSVFGHHVYLNRMPIGGFTGHIYLLPIGVKPEDDPSPQPVRSADRPADDDEDF